MTSSSSSSPSPSLLPSSLAARLLSFVLVVVGVVVVVVDAQTVPTPFDALARFHDVDFEYKPYRSGELVGGDFRGVDSMLANGFAVWDHATQQFERQRVSAAHTSKSIDASAELAFRRDTDKDAMVWIADDRRGVSYSDGEQLLAKLGMRSVANSGVSAGQFDCVDSDEQPLPASQCANTIDKLVVSGSAVYVCGHFNRAGGTSDRFFSSNVQNNTKYLARFLIDTSRNPATSVWELVWPTAYSATGESSGCSGGAAPCLSLDCSTMQALGESDNIVVMDSGALWTMRGGEFETNPQWRLVQPVGHNAEFRTSDEQLFAFGVGVQTGVAHRTPYLMSQPVGGSDWTARTVANAEWTGQWQSWAIGSIGQDTRVYFTLRPYPGADQLDVDDERRYRHHYVYQYTGQTGSSAEAEFTAIALGSKLQRFARSPHASTDPAARDENVLTSLDIEMFFDQKMRRLVVHSPELRYVLHGDVERAAASSTQPVDRVRRQQATYFATAVGGIVAFDEAALEWVPAYGGGFGEHQITKVIQRSALSANEQRIYFFGDFSHVFQTYAPFVAEYHDGVHDRLLFPVNTPDDTTGDASLDSPMLPLINSGVKGQLALAPNGDPLDASGASPRVTFARWLDERLLLVAGRFRLARRGTQVHSIYVINATSGDATTLPPLDALAGEPVPAVGGVGATTAVTDRSLDAFYVENRVGVRTRGGTPAFGASVTSGASLAMRARRSGAVADVAYDSKCDMVFVVGDFDSVGRDVEAHNVAAYSFTLQRWFSLGSAFANGEARTVDHTLSSSSSSSSMRVSTLYWDTGRRQLFVGGVFSHATARVRAANVAVFDVPSQCPPRDDDNNGNGGAPASSQRWMLDETQYGWRALNWGVHGGGVSRLLEHRGMLVAVGSFTSASGTAAPGAATRDMYVDNGRWRALFSSDDVRRGTVSTEADRRGNVCARAERTQRCTTFDDDTDRSVDPLAFADSYAFVDARSQRDRLYLVSSGGRVYEHNDDGLRLLASSSATVDTARLAPSQRVLGGGQLIAESGGVAALLGWNARAAETRTASELLATFAYDPRAEHLVQQQHGGVPEHSNVWFAS